MDNYWYIQHTGVTVIHTHIQTVTWSHAAIRPPATALIFCHCSRGMAPQHHGYFPVLSTFRQEIKRVMKRASRRPAEGSEKLKRRAGARERVCAVRESGPVLISVGLRYHAHVIPITVPELSTVITTIFFNLLIGERGQSHVIPLCEARGNEEEQRVVLDQSCHTLRPIGQHTQNNNNQCFQHRKQR